MDLNIQFGKSDYKEKSERFLLLGNPNHLRLLLLLEEAKKPMTAREITLVLEKEGVYKHRENTHRALKKLVKAGLIKKEKISKGIVYSLQKHKLY